jgi:inosine-uridine nucleoside N-ribohydrolase
MFSLSGHNVVLDNDGAPDDLAALRVFAKSDVLRGTVSTYGCANLERVIENTSRFLDLAPYTIDHEVFRGACDPVTRHPHGPLPRYFGDNGICDIELPSLSHSIRQLRKLHELANHIECIDGAVDYVITGPCTTFAQLIEAFPCVMQKIKTIHFMGMALHVPGNIGPATSTGELEAEYNVYLDPVSLHKVMQAAAESQIPFRVITWDACLDILLPQSVLLGAEPVDDQSRYIQQMIRRFFDIYGTDTVSTAQLMSQDEPHYTFCDLVVPLAMTGQHGEFEPMQLRIGTHTTDWGVTRPVQEGGLPIEVFRPADVEKLRHATLEALGFRHT